MLSFLLLLFAFCQVGYFPADCVEMIGEKVPQSVATRIPDATKPGNKFISFNGQVFYLLLLYMFLSLLFVALSLCLSSRHNLHNN